MVGSRCVLNRISLFSFPFRKQMSYPQQQQQHRTGGAPKFLPKGQSWWCTTSKRWQPCPRPTISSTSSSPARRSVVQQVDFFVAVVVCGGGVVGWQLRRRYGSGCGVVDCCGVAVVGCSGWCFWCCCCHRWWCWEMWRCWSSSGVGGGVFASVDVTVGGDGAVIGAVGDRCCCRRLCCQVSSLMLSSSQDVGRVSPAPMSRSKTKLIPNFWFKKIYIPQSTCGFIDTLLNHQKTFEQSHIHEFHFEFIPSLRT